MKREYDDFKEAAEEFQGDITETKDELLGSAGLGIGLFLLLLVALMARRGGGGRTVSTTTSVTGA